MAAWGRLTPAQQVDQRTDSESQLSGRFGSDLSSESESEAPSRSGLFVRTPYTCEYHASIIKYQLPNRLFSSVAAICRPRRARHAQYDELSHVRTKPQGPGVVLGAK
jgi:hypothetical protein